MQNRHTLEPTLTVARSQELCAQSIVLCAQAEASGLALLAACDPYGRATTDVARWSALLSRLAALRTRVRAQRGA